jgi:predicted nucleic acid-binding protein
LKRFVLDASVALAWFVDDPVSSYARLVAQSLVRDARAVVPSLWHLEMANGLAVAERRQILTSQDVALCVAQIEQLLSQAIESQTDFISFREALTAARSPGLSAYDAVYLETARRERLALATLDQRLRRSANRAGVAIFM